MRQLPRTLVQGQNASLPLYRNCHSFTEAPWSCPFGCEEGGQSPAPPAVDTRGEAGHVPDLAPSDKSYQHMADPSCQLLSEVRMRDA